MFVCKCQCLRGGEVMRTSMKCLGVIVMCVFLTFFAVSCTKTPELPGTAGTDPGQVTPEPVTTIVQDDDPYEDDINSTSEDITVTSPLSPNENISIRSFNYYTVNVNSNTVKSAVGAVSTDVPLSPELIMEFLIDSLEDESVIIGLDKVELANGHCTVSFDESIASVAETGAGLETAVLDAAAQSILDNIVGCSSVSFRIMGEAYSTVNLSMSLDEVYMDN